MVGIIIIVGIVERVVKIFLDWGRKIVCCRLVVMGKSMDRVVVC